MISYFDKFIIYHTSGHVNNGADILANQTSGYMIRKGQVHITRPMFVDDKVCYLDRPIQPAQDTDLTGFLDRSDPFFLQEAINRLWWPKIMMQPS